MKLVNLTPHPITLRVNGEDTTYEATGMVARIEQTTGPFPGTGGVIRDTGGIPLVAKHYGGLINVPPHEPGTLYIVSALVFDASDRDDLVAPNTNEAFRDESGRIVAVPSFLIKPSAAHLFTYELPVSVISGYAEDDDRVFDDRMLDYVVTYPNPEAIRYQWHNNDWIDGDFNPVKDFFVTYALHVIEHCPQLKAVLAQLFVQEYPKDTSLANVIAEIDPYLLHAIDVSLLRSSDISIAINNPQVRQILRHRQHELSGEAIKLLLES